MPDTRVLDMANAAALDGTEAFYADQSGDVQVSPAQIKTFVGGDGAALTNVDDTNVTLTLSANSSTALLKATSITVGWSGSLAETRGGTAQSTYTKGDILYSDASNSLAKLSGNTTTTKKFLSQTGDGAASAAPAWATALANVVEDTSPQLGGNLDVNGSGIAFTGATVTDVTGADTTLVSGTAGTSGNLVQWNADGDAVDASVVAANVYASGGTDVAVADGGTGASTAASALSNLSARGQGKETIWIPASAMVAATTNGPASGQIETSTNAVNVATLDFDGATDEYAHFNICFPKSWNLGTITYQLVWTSTATDTDGVVFALQGTAISDTIAIDTAYGSAGAVVDNAVSSAQLSQISSESSAITIGNTPATGDIVYFRLFRSTTNGSDTMAEDCQLIGIKIYFTTNAVDDT